MNIKSTINIASKTISIFSAIGLFSISNGAEGVDDRSSSLSTRSMTVKGMQKHWEDSKLSNEAQTISSTISASREALLNKGDLLKGPLSVKQIKLKIEAHLNGNQANYLSNLNPEIVKKNLQDKRDRIVELQASLNAECKEEDKKEIEKLLLSSSKLLKEVDELYAEFDKEFNDNLELKKATEAGPANGSSTLSSEIDNKQNITLSEEPTGEGLDVSQKLGASLDVSKKLGKSLAMSREKETEILKDLYKSLPSDSELPQIGASQIRVSQDSFSMSESQPAELEESSFTNTILAYWNYLIELIISLRDLTTSIDK